MGKNREIIEELAKCANDNEYSKDAFSNITLICCSKQMDAQGITSEEALKKAIELIKSGKTKKEIYSELLKLSGYKAQ